VLKSLSGGRWIIHVVGTIAQGNFTNLRLPTLYKT